MYTCFSRLSLEFLVLQSRACIVYLFCPWELAPYFLGIISLQVEICRYLVERERERETWNQPSPRRILQIFLKTWKSLSLSSRIRMSLFQNVTKYIEWWVLAGASFWYEYSTKLISKFPFGTQCDAKTRRTVFIMMIEWSLFGFVPPCGFTKALSSFLLFENFVDIFQIQGQLLYFRFLFSNLVKKLENRQSRNKFIYVGVKILC